MGQGAHSIGSARNDVNNFKEAAWKGWFRFFMHSKF